MNLRFIKNCLHQIDNMTGDVLVLNIFSDEKPLKGLSGVIDWRLNGKISRWIAEGKFDCSFKETLLFPPGNRLPFQKVCIFGIGHSATITEDHYKELSNFIITRLYKMQISDCTLCIPGSPLSPLPIKNRIEIFIEEFLQLGNENEQTSSVEPINTITIIEPPSIHKEILATFNSILRKVKQPSVREV